MGDQACIPAIYSRKSKFTGKGESIGNQIELCRQYIRACYGDSAAENALLYEDEGFSGGNLERPRFKQMMKDARAKKFSAVICYRLDRISRNIGDFASLIEELRDLGISFVSIKEQFDTSSPMGRAMMYIASVFSQLERETIAERIRDNMHELAKTGRWLGGVTPTGYASESISSITIDGKVKKACKLRTVPGEADLVRLIFRKFLETGSLTQTETFLLQGGYRTKNGKLFTRFAIRAILANPVYMEADRDAYGYLVKNGVDLFGEKEDFDGSHGVMAYNRTLQQQGRSNQDREMGAWIVSVGKHPGLVEGRIWVRAQELLAQNCSKSYRRPRSHAALLPGLLFCGGCGSHMRPKLGKGQNKSGGQSYSYLCTTKERSRMCACSMRNAGGPPLDRAVLQELQRLPEDAGELARQLLLLQKSLGTSWEDGDAELERLHQRASENEKEIRTLTASLARASGTPAENYIMERIGVLHAQSEAMEKQTQALERSDGQKLTEAELEFILPALSSWEAVIGCMTVNQRREAIRSCIRQAVWDGEAIHIYLSGSDPAPLGEDSK